tara:strand:+ start:521 stop:1429 length:909 start_codon:yes stop_codon:yes gene_type:complete
MTPKSHYDKALNSQPTTLIGARPYFCEQQNDGWQCDASFGYIIQCLQGVLYHSYVEDPKSSKRCILLGETHMKADERLSTPSLLDVIHKYAENLKIQIDFFIEDKSFRKSFGLIDGNDTILDRTRDEWRKCMHKNGCDYYPNMRVHWTDPSLDQVDYLDQIDNMVSSGMYNEWNDGEYPLVAEHFKTESDLFKVIRANKTVMKEIGKIAPVYKERFTMDYIKNKFWKIFEEEKEIEPNWKKLIAPMSRFALDVYTVARMLKKDQNFSNVFYGGQFHAKNISDMLAHVFETSAIVFDLTCPIA